MDWTNRLRLRQLQVLQSLAATQNISRSAEQLHMTQPALSKWLKELETDIGLPLFERHARGLRPTDYGRTLIQFAERIGNELDRARDEMGALRSGSSGRAVVGASGAAVASVVPRAVLNLLTTMPQANIELLEAPMDRLYQQLLQRELDVAVGRASPRYQDADILSEALYQERMHFAVRPNHPLAARRNLRWDDLLSQRWVVWTRDIPSRELLETSLTAAGVAIPRHSVQSNSVLATIALVADSDMVAVVSERAIELPERHKVLRRLPLKIDTQSAVTMYWRRDAVYSAAVEGLLAALRAAARRPAATSR
ncbi:MAG: LysR family transcriptional regulator [Ramlibacter sp.]|jgi:DNA-binding transcriptional LysR family regulator|uniref:LysR family transcriptional regulator n=1 Tax=Ramlibacter sp. TaxID=1917967 RepID=UPI0026033BEC|nr:LysR family transcriptional regulator [Ramlibacter sp.]MDB5751204.1 LysR family transcriptional regulator [Ramlibacter sp.]